MFQEASLSLEDGTVLEGTSFGCEAAAAGEVVFNTGMVGYPEALTDPSYRGQILVLTYPLVGNYGVPPYREDEYGLPLGFESDRIQVAGLVVSEHTLRYSHHSAARSLDDWLASEGVPALAGVDTRALTKRLRERGTMLGKIEVGSQKTDFFDPNASDLVRAVSARNVERRHAETNGADEEPPTVVLLDCGCKANIQRSLLRRGLNLVRVPYDHYFLGLDYDGLVISSGPGDPKICKETIRNVEHALAVGKPILGICLGHQLLALAAGAETYKLKFGHRSQNQPCLELGGSTQPDVRAVITSQNHGYAVREQDLPADWHLWFRNVNDGTVEGIRHAMKPFFGVQFHPEASPGPVDTAWIFDDFAARIRTGMR
jgi:carbamoyl-phosphate synthase small subunit